MMTTGPLVSIFHPFKFVKNAFTTYLQLSNSQQHVTRVLLSSHKTARFPPRKKLAIGNFSPGAALCSAGRRKDQRFPESRRAQDSAGCCHPQSSAPRRDQSRRSCSTRRSCPPPRFHNRPDCCSQCCCTG